MELLRFLKWHWDRWSFSHRVYMLGAGCVGFGVKDSIESGGPNIIMQTGFVLWFMIFLKWFVWDAVRESWLKYQAHRNELLNTIRDSEG